MLRSSAQCLRRLPHAQRPLSNFCGSVSRPNASLRYAGRFEKNLLSIRVASYHSSAIVSSDSEKDRSSQEVLDKCATLYDTLTELNDKVGGTAIPPSSDRATSLPFCLLVGNHSSGKSSFINYILERNIQKAGVAPTDDTFTVIAPSVDGEDADADGPTLVGNPDLGFSSLRQFGPTLIHHTQLKVRKSPLKFMLVDSPGMIDAPTTHHPNSPTSEYKMDRGYDFQNVVRWLAQRADVVLLFFDPDKPGTTGETMSVLLNSLSGMDHKLLIVLNKADQFHKIHDFARAYGSLCWNLSKVIPRKDLPPIFTMCLPSAGVDERKTSLPASLSDLEHTRDDVVEQVMQAPKRRVDNVITNLYDSTSMLILYSKVWNDLVLRYRREWRSCRIQEAGVLTAGVTLFGGFNYFGLDPSLQGGVLGTSILGVGGLLWYHQYMLKGIRENLTSSESLATSFQRTHSRQVQDADEFVASLWQRVRGNLKQSLDDAFDGGAAPSPVSASELQRLEDILVEEIPKLRRAASDTKY